MRVLFAAFLALGLALVVIGASAPEHFVLSMLGMLVLAGTAGVGIASSMQHGPRVHR